MWTEGTAAVSRNVYTGIIGALVQLIDWKHNCFNYADATTVIKNVADPRLAQPQLLRQSAWAVWLSFHSCNYVASIGCCQYGTWATCTHQFQSCLQFLSHTDAAAVVETHYCPGVVKYRYRYQYQYHTVTGLAACRSVPRVCISLSFGHNWALLCIAVCSTHNVTVALLAVCATV